MMTSAIWQSDSAGHHGLDSNTTTRACPKSSSTSLSMPRPRTDNSANLGSGGLRGEKIVLPPFQNISRIAAGGRDDPNGEIWRGHRCRSPSSVSYIPPRLIVPGTQSPSLATRNPRPSTLKAQIPFDDVQGRAFTRSSSLDTRPDQPATPNINDSDDDTSSESEGSSNNPLDDEGGSTSMENAPTVSGWEAFVLTMRGDDGNVMYRCLWEIEVGQTCTYMGKRQLVKRHVENTHMQIKRFKCCFCTRRFSQKSARQIHQNSHTGAKPHPCMYNCGKWFRDPSKRTRHAYRVHAYEPKLRQCNNPRYRGHGEPDHRCASLS